MLTRRSFLTASATGLAFLALPELVVPKQTIFLPPKGGWYDDIRMQECMWYDINNDYLRISHDMAWIKDGVPRHYSIQGGPPPFNHGIGYEQAMDQLRALCRKQFAKVIERDGLQNAKRVVLSLSNYPISRYV